MKFWKRLLLIIFLQILTLGGIFIGMCFDHNIITKNFDHKYVVLKNPKHQTIENITDIIKTKEAFFNKFKGKRVIIRNGVNFWDKGKFVAIVVDGKTVTSHIISDSNADTDINRSLMIARVNELIATENETVPHSGLFEAKLNLLHYSIIAGVAFIILFILLFVPKNVSRKVNKYQKKETKNQIKRQKQLEKQMRKNKNKQPQQQNYRNNFQGQPHPQNPQGQFHPNQQNQSRPQQNPETNSYKDPNNPHNR